MSDYISETLKARIREQAGDRCGYCQSLQKYVWGTLEIEHMLPKSKGGQTNRPHQSIHYTSGRPPTLRHKTSRRVGGFREIGTRWINAIVFAIIRLVIIEL